MPRKQHKYHYIYKITNVITNNYYIGMHSTSDFEDEYMGSGKRIKYSIVKYGLENHTKEIIEYCKNREELVLKEKEIVNEELLKDCFCLNLMIGGEGGRGFTQEERVKAGINSGNKHKLKLLNDPDYRELHVNKSSKIMKDLNENGKIKPFDWTGKKHKEETKYKIGISNSQYKGELNSQFGTCWIYSLEEKKSIKIKNEDLDNWLSKGWNKGRKIIFK
jgi:hypothetical protein